jgi:hypothetical protein
VLSSALPNARVEAWRKEWRSNPRLRLGLLMVLFLLALGGLLSLRDIALGVQAQADAAKQEANRLRPLLAQGAWAQRAEDAEALLKAARELQWVAPSLGAGQARLQDELRAWAEKAGLKVLDVAVLPSTAGVATSASAVQAARGYPLRIKLTFEFQRQPLMAFLAEVQAASPLVLIDNFSLKAQPQPGRVELELRIQLRIQEPQP